VILFIIAPCPCAVVRRNCTAWHGNGGEMRSILLLLISGALAGCATGRREPSSPQVDTRALCHQLAQASASSPDKISGDYENQCLIAHGVRPQR
jgi:hypothetical protein